MGIALSVCFPRNRKDFDHSADRFILKKMPMSGCTLTNDENWLSL